MARFPRLIPVCLMAGCAVALAACTGSPTVAPDPTGADASTSTPTMTTTSGDTPDLPVPTTTNATSTLPAASIEDLNLVLVEAGAGFDAPVLLIADPGGGDDLVVEQSGRVVRADTDHTVVLDIGDDVAFGGEQGLLGLAFHPAFERNGFAYVNYVNTNGDTTIERFAMIDGMFDTGSRRILLVIDQPARNHNGGMIAFGPKGYLWIGMGDGGASDDRFGNGQDPHSLLGAMLRIDVDADDGRGYAIPSDNPFADGVGGAPEVWAIGLRNPWRFSFDGDAVWIADVGQNDIEEVNVVEAEDPGLNLGWPIMEGSSCFSVPDCDASLFVAPVAQYGHDVGCSITGGYVYRGSAIPALTDQYFYSDFCSGLLRSSTSEGTGIDWTAQVGRTPQVSGFGVGGDGELYIVSHEGTLYRLEESS